MRAIWASCSLLVVCCAVACGGGKSKDSTFGNSGSTDDGGDAYDGSQAFAVGADGGPSSPPVSDGASPTPSDDAPSSAEDATPEGASPEAGDGG